MTDGTILIERQWENQKKEQGDQGLLRDERTGVMINGRLG